VGYHPAVITSRSAGWAFALWLSLAPAVGAQVPTPEEHFGFKMGADRQLASAEAIERYFDLVGTRSDRVRVLDLGRTTNGHRTVAAAISAAENIRDLDRIRSDNAALADPRSLSTDEGRALARSQRSSSPSAPAFTRQRSAAHKPPTSCCTCWRRRTTRRFCRCCRTSCCS
jgi:hypothetical protein